MKTIRLLTIFFLLFASLTIAKDINVTAKIVKSGFDLYVDDINSSILVSKDVNAPFKVESWRIAQCQSDYNVQYCEDIYLAGLLADHKEFVKRNKSDILTKPVYTVKPVVIKEQDLVIVGLAAVVGAAIGITGNKLMSTSTKKVLYTKTKLVRLKKAQQVELLKKLGVAKIPTTEAARVQLLLNLKAEKP